MSKTGMFEKRSQLIKKPSTRLQAKTAGISSVVRTPLHPGMERKGFRNFMPPYPKPRYFILSFLIASLLKFSLFAFSLPSGSTSVSNCGGDETNKFIIDMAGRWVMVPTAVRRIVALNGSLRFVVYLQAADLLVGVERIEKDENYITNASGKKRVTGRPYQAAIASLIDRLPVIGQGGPERLPDFESLLSVTPDLVLVFESKMADIIQERTGLPAVVISHPITQAVDFSEIKKIFFFLGELLDRRKRATELSAFIDSCLLDLKSRTAEVRPISVFVGALNARGSHGLTSTEAEYPPLLWLKTRNVVDELKKRGHLFIDREQLLIWDPEYIFIDAAGLPLVAEDYKKNQVYYQRLSAVRNDKVFTVFPFNFYRTNFEVLLANSYFIGKILYPDRFADLVPEQKTAEIIKTFVGADVFYWLKEGYSGFCQVEFLENGLRVNKGKEY